MKGFRLLSYNIHKGFQSGGLKYVLTELREHIESSKADIVFLQEVHGKHNKLSNYHELSQFEFLADRLWPYYGYGKNAIYTTGDHGNAILSKYPLLFQKQINLAMFPQTSRGILHGAISLTADSALKLHLLCVHLGFLNFERKRQLYLLQNYIFENITAGDPYIIAGDFNDWNKMTTLTDVQQQPLKEAGLEYLGTFFKTFPSFYPQLCLDRIYFSGLDLRNAAVLQQKQTYALSDHLAIYADFIY